MSVRDCAQGAYRAPDHDNFRNGRRACFGTYRAFTLIELLVVIAIIAILASILFPVFANARQSGAKARCATQLKQLIASVVSYADDNNGRYVPAASDIYTSGGGHRRWHGYREDPFDPKSRFDPRKGPLYSYMGKSGGLKQCPNAASLRTGNSSEDSEGVEAFESGCGGFGYNAAYVGGTKYKNWSPASAQVASLTSDIAQPAHTIMFADAAMATTDADGSPIMIEYSFAEAPRDVLPTGLGKNLLSASIHFRHNGGANIGWCDGHATTERMSSSGRNIYTGKDSRAFGLGWFGPQDNSLFDNR